MVNREVEEFGIKEYSVALDLLFNNNLIEYVAIRIELDGYVLYLEIKNGKTEIIVYKEHALNCKCMTLGPESVARLC